MDCLKLIATRFPGKSIGCIAPYTAMVDQLMKAYPSLLSQNKDLAIEVEFDTVDGFQGREKDFMVHVYPNTTSEGFTIKDGRSNVTVTRAKFGAYTVTHVEGVASMENAKRNPFHAYLQHLIAECAQFRIPEKNAGTYNLTTKFSMKSTEPVEDAGADNSTDWGAPTAGADWGRPAPDLGVYQAYFLT
jgi:superfamily I DNA and/or RNA helicase